MTSKIDKNFSREYKFYVNLAGSRKITVELYCWYYFTTTSSVNIKPPCLPRVAR